jgi:hypothetical protein
VSEKEKSTTNDQVNQEKKPRLFRIIDIIIITILLIASVAFIPLMRSHQQSDTVQVYRIDQLIAEYPLDKDRIVTLEGVISSADMEINDGRVRIAESGCPNQICVYSGWIDEPYQAIICAPNRLLVTIKSTDGKEKADAIER